MKRDWLLDSTAVFAPPDEGGADVIDGSGDQIVDSDNELSTDDSGGTPPAGAETPAPASKVDHSTPRVESITDSIRRATTEVKQKSDAAAKLAAGGKKAAQAAKATETQAAGAKAGDTAKPSSETTTTDTSTTAPQAGPTAPESWKKEEKAVWDSLPDLAKQAITRREADASKGVNDLRARYQDIDTAIAPYKAVMTQNNVTPAQAISQLFKWHMELAGPNKIAAYVQLGKNFGIDSATVAAALATQQEAPASGAATQDTNPIPETLRPVITDLESRIKSFEERDNLAAQNAARQTWANWSKDKPHAETVRTLMANLINSDLALIQAGQPQVSNTIVNGSIDMDAAYTAAIYANPQVRQTILQEEQAKRDKEAKAAADKARKAATSMRSGAPAGTISPASGTTPRNESVRDSIQRALQEVRGTQH